MLAKLPPWLRIALLAVGLLLVPAVAWLLVPAPEPPRRAANANVRDAPVSPFQGDEEAAEDDGEPAAPREPVEPEPEAEEVPAIRGMVTAGERVVPNARITCTRRGHEPLEIVTMGNGQFSLPIEAEGCVAVATSPSNGVTPPVELRRGVENRLEFPAQGSIAGVVEDERGFPLERFFVEIDHVVLADGTRAPNGLSRVFSDPEGRFSLDNMGAGRWTILFSAAGRPPTKVEVAVQPGKVTDDVRVRLQRGATLVGTVVDRETKRPIGGAVVRLDGSSRESAIEPATTSPGGEFRLEGVPAGAFGVEVQHADYLNRIVSGIDTKGQRQHRITVDLAPAKDAGGRLEMSGIGASLNADGEGNVRVVGVREGGPAERAGMLADDVIAIIDGKSAAGLGVQEVVQLLRGPEGTEVLVGLRRGDDNVQMTIVREVMVH